MSNTISSWFIPFWYSAASSENTTLEMINKKRKELTDANNAPSFPKTLTPVKAVASGVGILGILGAIFGFSKDNGSGKVLGIGALILGVIGYFTDKFFVKNSTEAKKPDGNDPISVTPGNGNQNKGPGKISKLVEQLKNGIDIYGAERDLIKENNPEAIPLLIDIVDGKYGIDKAIVGIRVLGSIGDERCLVALSKCLQNEELRGHASEQLEFLIFGIEIPINDETIREQVSTALVPSLKIPIGIHAVRVAKILRKIEHPAAVEGLIASLDLAPTDPELAQAAANALCFIKDPRGIEPVFQFERGWMERGTGLTSFFSVFGKDKAVVVLARHIIENTDSKEDAIKELNDTFRVNTEIEALKEYLRSLLNSEDAFISSNAKELLAKIRP